MLIEDDASRFITGYGKSKRAKTKNAIKVVKKVLSMAFLNNFILIMALNLLAMKDKDVRQTRVSLQDF